VLLGETLLYDWRAKGGRLAELLEFARVRPLGDATAQQSLL
jgi:type III restriction enzyme